MSDSKGLYRSVSALKRLSCTIRGAGPCSGSTGSRLCWPGLCCGLCWESPSSLSSSDLSETASFSTSAARRRELRQGHNACLGPPDPSKGVRGIGCPPGSAGMGDIHLVTPPPAPACPCPAWPPPAPFDVHRAQQAPHPRWQEARGTPLLPGPSTARAARTARLSSESRTNIQCGRIWRLRRICFTCRGREGAAETAEPQLEAGLELERPRKSSAGGKWDGRA